MKIDMEEFSSNVEYVPKKSNDCDPIFCGNVTHENNET